MLLLRLKALADDTRLQIINILFSGRKKVSDIIKEMKKSQPAVSIALKQLLYAGIITQEREGKCIYYSIQNKEELKKALELLKK